ncbi:MAG: hypothetical protein AAFY11_04160 [Cyanobacteria bacterium J06641_5]
MTAIQKKEKISQARLPLAVYREIAAHLQQVHGVVVEILPQTAREFDYLQSQVGGILLCYPISLDASEVQNLEAILASYANRYGDWVRESL